MSEEFKDNMIWNIAQPDPTKIRNLARKLNIPGILAGLLLNRGIHSEKLAKKFLDPQLNDLHDPFLLCDLDKAVKRIQQAIKQTQKILIYGDYDVDGNTAVVILKKALQMLGANCSYYIPRRFIDGYGLQTSILQKAVNQGVRLVITVDTGIRAFESIQKARQLGLDCIITDHHLPENGLPNALAIVNPNRTDCLYPDKNLSGVGVAFKLIQALFIQEKKEKYLPSFLKVVAIGTIADLVPLIGENRIFAKLGLEGLMTPSNPGLKSLIKAVGLEGKVITSTDISFRLAPRINAVGRMGGSCEAVELFITKDQEEANQLATKMGQLNQERQFIENQILEKILQQIDSNPDLAKAPIKVIDGENWHLGVLGIVASKITDRFNCPTLIISKIDKMGSGSGRSPKGFHLLKALSSCHDLFERFGGHAQAAGFQLPADKIGELRERINQHARLTLDSKPTERSLNVDGELRLSDIDTEIYRNIQRLSPFGNENPSPLFVARNVTLIAEPRILKQKHLKFRVEQDGKAIDALAWNFANYLPTIQESSGVISLAFELSENLQPGYRLLQSKDLQLVVRDIHVH